MGKPYSSDLRGRFVAAMDKDMSASAGRGAGCVSRARQRFGGPPPGNTRLGPRRFPRGVTGVPRPLRPTRRRSSGGWRKRLFLREIVSRLADEGIESSGSSVARLLARHGITRKKDCGRCRAGPRGHRLRPQRMAGLNPDKLVFIDESGFDTRMTRRFGRGAPCVGAVPHGHWRSNTFIAGLRSNRIDAPMLIEAAMEGDAFRARLGQMRAPTLRAGGMVVCDILGGHKNAKARAAIETRSAELRFLPACFPDPNPIEMVFAKLKALVRSAAARCDTLCSAIASALTISTPQECARYLRHAGYDSRSHTHKQASLGLSLLIH